jgi:hypothetical protein
VSGAWPDPRSTQSKSTKEGILLINE